MTTPPQTPAPQAPVTTVPLPPPGPGVVVPFAAPPRDEDKSRTVVGVIIAIVVSILLCGGLLGGFGAIVVWTSNEMTAQAGTAAEKFLDDIVAQEYSKAYDSVCKDIKDNLSDREFVQQWRSRDIESYVIGSTTNSDNGDLLVETQLTDSSGQRSKAALTVAVEGDSLAMAVCGWLSGCRFEVTRSRLASRP